MMAKEKRINRRALFADETQDYRIPEEPDSGEMTELRFRTGAGEAQQVFCVVMETGERLEMKKVASDGRFDFFQTTMRVGDDAIHYCFFVQGEGDSCFFGRLGASKHAELCGPFVITPGFHTPEWAKGAVMYQIFVDRFCNGDPDNDVKERE